MCWVWHRVAVAAKQAARCSTRLWHSKNDEVQEEMFCVFSLREKEAVVGRKLILKMFVVKLFMTLEKIPTVVMHGLKREISKVKSWLQTFHHHFILVQLES